MRNPHLYFFILSLLGCFSVRGQEQKRISGNFEGYSFARMVNEIEAQSNYHIYYDPADVDSLQINIKTDQATISQLFDRLFKNTDFHYALTVEGDVFISRKLSIQTSLPEHFFDPGKNGTDTSSVQDFYAEDVSSAKTNLKISAENKLFEIGNRSARTSGKVTV